MHSHKLNNSDALKFIFAGKSIVTFLNTKTGNRFTFKTKIAKNSELFFVSVLTNPEMYQYVGTVVDKVFKHGKKSKISADAQSVRTFEYVLNKLKANNLPDFIEVWHEGRCGKCGKTLTDPVSIERGFGPFCINKV
jgi:hypothetical protein